ncbi:GMC family oxidoreductase N-terminal domain-containing protein [Endozoicomonas sp. 4G]|uniref:GMC family oxidoreductase N-terminal domain-containing protein n=1 Tax=Endozoicomonas sp. 4G TaxID=2872754 RepID=UPI002078F522|nr:GMC family oxidoreductase N-terminal domain-containing protein [Endozoicomonas sp. 4G]
MYDCIIEDGGSAGCVLASRLSENSSLNVCLFKAGSANRNPAIKLPPRGCTLGGSSASNAMIYIRGHPEDYDSWADNGNLGPSFLNLLPYFKKSQHQDNPDFNGFSQEGVGLYQLTQKKGWRCSTSHVFLANARKRLNLRFRAEKAVDMILANTGSGRVVRDELTVCATDTVPVWREKSNA